MTGPALTIANGQDDPTVLPLDEHITATPDEPGRIALGWAGDRMVTLDLTHATPEWLDDLVRGIWTARQRLAYARGGNEVTSI